jgi:hypothetical protein
MAVSSKDLTVNYQSLQSIPYNTRQSLLGSTSLMEAINRELTPGQRASLFPSYFKEKVDETKKTFSGSLASPTDIKTLNQNPAITPYLSSIPTKSKANIGTQETQSEQATKQAMPPGKKGTYRPVYQLSDDDLSDEVINTIAGEARLSDPRSLDGVVNNMLNRVGTKSWGPAGNLRQVARAPGQYTGYRKASPEEAEMIRQRIREVASGTVPDPTNGADAYRARSYLEGQGRGKTFFKLASAQGFNDVGGNVYAKDPNAEPGPYAAYSPEQVAQNLEEQKKSLALNEPIPAGSEPKTESEIAAEKYSQSASIIPPADVPTADDIMGDVPQSLAQQAANRTLSALGLHEHNDKAKIREYLNGRQLDPEQTAWCAAILNASLATAGLKGTGSDVANSFVNYGSGVSMDQVMPGDIIVDTKGRKANETGGHVMQATGRAIYDENGRLKIEIVGGNQGKPGQGRVTSHYIYPNQNFVARRATAAEILDPSRAMASVGNAGQAQSTQQQTAEMQFKKEVSGSSEAEIERKKQAGILPPDTPTNIDLTADVAHSYDNPQVATASEVGAEPESYPTTGDMSAEPESVVAMAEGGMIHKPYLAHPVDGKGPKVLMGEAGSEAIVPQKKIAANDIGASSVPDTLSMIMQAKEIANQNPPVSVDAQESTKIATAKMTQSLTNDRPTYSVNADHHPIAPSARKAYADAKLEPRLNNLSPTGTVYSNHGYTGIG